MPGIRDSLADPGRRRLLVWAALAMLAWMALLLRCAIDSRGVLDVDVVNFGLAAQRFDILDRQPQPPGYIGYVLYLKIIHLVVPDLDPINLAKWGARLCGMFTVPAAYWGCRQLIANEEPDALGRPLAAGWLAMVHPLLWYYGADGQSHAAEALVTVLLFGIVVGARRYPSTGRYLLTVVAFGLAGSLRPTISLLSSPLLVWLFRGRPLRDWALALIVGLASVAVWAAPLIALSGGWELFQRANRALIGDLFIASFSVFGTQARPVLVIANIVKTLWWGAVALIPAWAWCAARARPQGWQRAWIAVVALNLLFYGLVYAAEAGYLAAVAGLACLVPATWPVRPGLRQRVRIGLVAAATPAFMLLGPAAVPVPHHPDAAMPTLAHVMDVQGVQDVYRTAVCGAARGRRAVLLTDNPSNTSTRPIPLMCPNVAVALYVYAMPFRPERVIDAWMIFFSDHIMAVPTGVPLEPGPPAHVQLPDPVELLLLAPDNTADFDELVLRGRSCDPESYVDLGSGIEIVGLAARCLSTLETPTHTIDLTAPPRLGATRYGGL